MGLRDFSLLDVIERNALLHAGATAFVCAGRRISRPEHLARVEKLAAAGIGGRIARYKRAKLVVFVDAMPRTSSGAIDRNKVEEAHAHA